MSQIARRRHSCCLNVARLSEFHLRSGNGVDGEFDLEQVEFAR